MLQDNGLAFVVRCIKNIFILIEKTLDWQYVTVLFCLDTAKGAVFLG